MWFAIIPNLPLVLLMPHAALVTLFPTKDIIVTTYLVEAHALALLLLLLVFKRIMLNFLSLAIFKESLLSIICHC